MVDCPKCSTKLDADFGMITCPNCSSVVFVEFDGSAKIADENPTVAAVPALDDLDAPQLSSFDQAIADDLFAPGTLETQQIVDPADISQTREPDFSTSQDEIVSPDDPLGVTAFAQSEFSQGKDGPFVFNLFIGGLDSKEIRESLREAMNDSRFGWDANKLLSQIRDGHLQLKNLSPVQASILVNRLKRLSLTISWEQHAITTVEKF